MHYIPMMPSPCRFDIDNRVKSAAFGDSGHQNVGNVTRLRNRVGALAALDEVSLSSPSTAVCLLKAYLS